MGRFGARETDVGQGDRVTGQCANPGADRVAGSTAAPNARTTGTPQSAAGESVLCPRCGARAHATPNPYFGTGLAVHRAVLLCAACGFAGLQDNEPEAVEVVEAPHPTGPLQRVLALIRHA